MKYFYAIYDRNVHEVFNFESTSDYKFYKAHFDIPWDDIFERTEGLYSRGDIQPSLFENGYFMGGSEGQGFMIFNIAFKGDSSNMNNKVYKKGMDNLKPFIRELKIDDLL